MSIVSLTVITDMDIAYKFQIRVMLPDKSQRVEVHTVSESDTRFGSAMAMGKAVRYYESLKESKQILDYKFLV